MHINLKRLQNNPEFGIIRKRRSLKERLRIHRYLDFGREEAAKIPDPKTSEYFFLLYCAALAKEDQIIDLQKLRKRAAELAAEDDAAGEAEPEPPPEAPPRSPIIEALDELIPPEAKGDPKSARGPPDAPPDELNTAMTSNGEGAL